MATINIGGVNPFGKRAKTLEEAINMAMDNDTIKIHKHHLMVKNTINVNKTLYIEGNNCSISVANGKMGINMLSGGLHMQDVNFVLGMQNNAVCFQDSYFGKSHFTNVNFEHAKTKLRETFPSLSVAAPSEGVSGCELSFENCKIDYIDANLRNIDLQNSTIGKFYKMPSTVFSDNMTASNLTTTNTYYSCASGVEIDKMTTPGQVMLNGKFNINELDVVNGEFDKGSGKLAKNHQVQKMIQDYHAGDFGPSQDVIINCFGGDKYQSDLTIGKIVMNQQVMPFVKRLWFNLKQVNLNISNSELARLEMPSIASGGSIAMQSVKDYSDWRVKDVTLSNRESSSQLFSKSIVKKGNEKVTAANGNKAKDFGAMAELDSMIGLTGVKKQVKSFIRNVHVNEELKKKNVAVNDTISYHMVLAGNPGSGKTAVARLIGQALYENGVLKTNKFTEVQGGDLVAPYVGQTAPKTRQVVEQALDGVLFIDEAYVLTHEDGNSFKDEAVAELLKDIDDHRDRIVCILAGYTPNMRKFFADSNPGLKSRFANWINFPDYTPTEMLKIMMFMINKKKLYLADKNTAITLRKMMMDQMGHLDVNSGNGRFVRNALEKIELAKNSRIGALPSDQLEKMSAKEMMTITREDVVNGMKDLAVQQTNMNGLQGMGQ